MSWNPNSGQDPNQASQYGGYAPPPQPTDPYSGQSGYQQGGYQQQGNYQQGGYQQGGYQQGGYQQPGQQGYQQYQQPGYQQPGYQQPGQSYATPGSTSQYGPSSMNMDPKIAAGLSYVLTWVTGLIFFFVEKQNRFVRFHAMQSILFFGGLTVINIILSVLGAAGIPFLGIIIGLLSVLVWIVWVVGYIVLLINGFQGKYFKLPIVGDYAEKYANQGTPGTPM
jgi:uncharacterized membrane protein